MMRVAAHFDQKKNSIVIRKQMTQGKQSHTAGTVLLTDVRVGGSLRGLLIEEHESPIAPTNTVANWRRLYYYDSKGYVDKLSGEKVERAQAVYMVGSKAFYLP